MEKYEFKIKSEQMLKLADAGDYRLAMQIADGIDWRRVRNANMLSSVSEIYEKNGEYEEARDILMMAFDRSPVSKRFLYKLSEISLKSGDVQGAQDFYRSFSDANPEDSRILLLRYSILKSKGAGPEQLSGILEEYLETELDERWLYELAVLYDMSGRAADCVRACDRIMLLFGQGQYVEKAHELKSRYISSPADMQEKAVQNNPMQDNAEDEDRSIDVFAENSENYNDETPEEPSQAIEYEEESDEQTNEEADEKTAFAEERGYSNPALRAIASGASVQSPTQQLIHEMLSDTADEDKPVDINCYHMIIEAVTIEEGFQVAVNEIKYFHEKYGLSYKAAKISAEKLNERGFSVFEEKLREKDLIIINAGDLSYTVLDEISKYISAPVDSSSIILIDVEDHFDKMAEERPDFIKLFDLVSALPEKKEEELLEEVSLDSTRIIQQAPIDSEPEDKKKAEPETKEQQSLDRVEEKKDTAAGLRVSMERPTRPLDASERIEPDRVEDIPEPAREKKKGMDTEAFVSYAEEYAASIDCVIPEKAIRSLRDRVELMIDDGEELSRIAAEDMIEEAADKAEKPKLFRAKYDKNDKLILHEDCFL